MLWYRLSEEKTPYGGCRGGIWGLVLVVVHLCLFGWFGGVRVVWVPSTACGGFVAVLGVVGGWFLLVGRCCMVGIRLGGC